MKPRPTSRCDPARLAALEALCDFERKPSRLPTLLESHIRGKNLSSLDRSFVSHLVYGVIRYREQLDFVLRRHVSEKGFEKRRQKAALLRLGAFQLMPDSRVPPSAAIDESVKLARTVLGEGITGFINAVLRKVAAGSAEWDELLPQGSTAEELSIRFSQPKWLVELLVRDHGMQKAVGFLAAFLDRLDITVRINRLRTGPGPFEDLLRSRGIPVVRSPLSDDYYFLPSNIDVSTLESITCGDCFVQNAASGVAVDLLSPGEDDRLLDMCAAPGGKTAAIAVITGRPENITALEIDSKRANEMRLNLERLLIRDVRVNVVDGRVYSESEFDKVIVDAPCSGLGTLAKHPEIKYTQSAENIQKLAAVQLELLNNAARISKVGGVVVYSVCTLSSVETVGVLDEFLRSNRNFVLDVPGDFRYHQFVTPDGVLLIPPGGCNQEGMFAFRARKTM